MQTYYPAEGAGALPPFRTKVTSVLGSRIAMSIFLTEPTPFSSITTLLTLSAFAPLIRPTLSVAARAISTFFSASGVSSTPLTLTPEILPLRALERPVTLEASIALTPSSPVSLI